MTQRFSRRLPSLLFSLLLAAGFCLFFAACNTPLGPSVGSDNAIYITMGTALAQGYAPYTEIFDHKGPLLFLMQMIPQALSGGNSTLAVFLMEIVFVFLGLRLMAALARRLGLRQDWLAQLAYLALLGPLMDGGNLNEEYAACFILAALLCAVSAFDREDWAPPRKLALPAFGMGAMTMLAFLLRANNALSLLGLTAGLALALLAGRRFADLGFCALGFLCGCALASAPVLLWLGAQGALGEAVYGSIIHNMMYAQTDGIGRVRALLATGYGHTALALAALSCLGALAHALRAPGGSFRLTGRTALCLSLVLATAAAGMSAFISHKYYTHYLMALVPLAALGAVMLLGALPARRVVTGTAAAVCCLALVAGGAAANARRLSDLAAQGSFAEDARTLYALVPEDERDSFMAYRVEPKWYVYAKALPCMRFYFLQEILAQADPAVMDEIVSAFEQNPPRWLVLFYQREFGPPYDERVAQIFETSYEFVDACGEYQLLRLKDEP